MSGVNRYQPLLVEASAAMTVPSASKSMVPIASSGAFNTGDQVPAEAAGPRMALVKYAAAQPRVWSLILSGFITLWLLYFPVSRGFHSRPDANGISDLGSRSRPLKKGSPWFRSIFRNHFGFIASDYSSVLA